MMGDTSNSDCEAPSFPIDQSRDNTLDTSSAAADHPFSSGWEDSLQSQSLERQALAEDFLHIDHEIVPCVPLVELHGLSCLSASAQEEFSKQLRPDLLRPSDTVELYFFQARHLMATGKVKITFPSYYESAIVDALTKDPLSVDLAQHSPFFFDLGIQLCNMLPEYEWPTPNLLNVLKKARQQRRIHIATQSDVLTRHFLRRLTYCETTIHKAAQVQKSRMGPFA